MADVAKPGQVLQWVQLAQQGNEQAFAMLMARYRKGIVLQFQKKMDNHADAEDLTQLTFTKAFEKISTFSDQYNFSTWLYRIAHNCRIDFERKNKEKNKIISIDYLVENEELQSNQLSRNPEEDMIAKQDTVLAKSLLAKLKPQYRTVIEMRYLYDCTYDGIAQKLNIPMGTVKTQLSRAKEQLVKLLVHNNSF